MGTVYLTFVKIANLFLAQANKSRSEMNLDYPCKARHNLDGEV